MLQRISAVALGAVAILALASCAIQTESPPTSTSTPVSTTASAPSPTDAPARPSAAPVGPAVATPIVGSVLAPPAAVPATDGKVHLAYELQLTNVLDQEVTLTSITRWPATRRC